MLHFGSFELDADTFELRRDGSRVEVEPQVLEVIFHLARHRDRMVRKEELLDEVWGDRFVSESALTSRIKSARQALGDDGRTQAMIRTIHGRGYQFVPHVTDSESMPPSEPAPGSDHGGTLDEARQAVAEAAWRAARAAFAALGLDALTAADLEMWAEAAWWDSDVVECIGIRQAAFRRYVAAEDHVAAARVAIALSDDYLHRGAPTVHRSWAQRADALLSDASESREAGQLLRLKTEFQLDEAKDPVAALALNDELMPLAARVDDPDLTALGLQDRGRCLVALGRVDEGLGVIDEAMLLAATTETSPNTLGRMYCNMLSTCIMLGQFRRAQDWNDEAITWCAGHSESPFPGVCQVYRAGLRRRMGELERSITDLEHLSSNSQFTNVSGSALLELGEIHLRRGDLDLAEAAFLQAHAHAADPTTGFAQIAVEQGRPLDGVTLLNDALHAHGNDHMTKARLLPLLVDAAAMADQLDVAAEAAAALSEVAEVGAEACRGAAAYCEGTVHLLRGDARARCDALRIAVELFAAVALPFELASARLALAAASLEAGSEPTARIERATAIAALADAGAVPLGTARMWAERTSALA